MATTDSPDPTCPFENIEKARGPSGPVGVLLKFGKPDGEAAALWNDGRTAEYSEELPPIVKGAVTAQSELAAKINLLTFFSALGKRLGAYWYYDQLATHQLSVSDVKAEVETALRALHQAWAALIQLPPLAKERLQQMSAEETPYAHHADPVLARVVDVQQIVNDLLQLQHRLEDEFPPQEGRPSQWHRDALLTDICELARAHATAPLQWQEASKLAQSILIAARVSVPESLHETLRIVRKVQKKRNKPEQCGTSTDSDGNDATEV